MNEILIFQDEEMECSDCANCPYVRASLLLMTMVYLFRLRYGKTIPLDPAKDITTEIN